MARIEIVEKFRTEKDGPLKAYIIDTDFENYEPAANVQIPRLLTASSTDRDLEFRLQDVKVNIPIDDSKFRGN